MVLLVCIFDQVACHPIFVGGPIHYVMSTRVLSPLLHSPLPCAGARPQQAAQGGRERHPPVAQRPAGPRPDGPVDRRGLETGVDRQAGAVCYFLVRGLVCSQVSVLPFVRERGSPLATTREALPSSDVCVRGGAGQALSVYHFPADQEKCLGRLVDSESSLFYPMPPCMNMHGRMVPCSL